MTYSHFQHRHNFAVWCAARAVQRGFAKTPKLKKALESSGVVEFIKDIEETCVSQVEFNMLHERWCYSILRTGEKDNVEGASYGRAAKLLAVYIKSMIVIQVGVNNLSTVAHPPIDRIILQNISEDVNIIHPNKASWKKIKWTQLKKADYNNLIADFRHIFEGRPFWFIEEYWIVQDEE